MNSKIDINDNYSEKIALWETLLPNAHLILSISALKNIGVDSLKKTLNLEIIAVATDDSRTQKRVKPLVNGKGWTYNILLDTNQDFKRAMSIVNIPYTIVVKNGLIVHIQNGYVPGSENELLDKLKSL